MGYHKLKKEKTYPVSKPQLKYTYPSIIEIKNLVIKDVQSFFYKSLR